MKNVSNENVMSLYFSNIRCKCNIVTFRKLRSEDWKNDTIVILISLCNIKIKYNISNIYFYYINNKGA